MDGLASPLLIYNQSFPIVPAQQACSSFCIHGLRPQATNFHVYVIRHRALCPGIWSPAQPYFQNDWATKAHVRTSSYGRLYCESLAWARSHDCNTQRTRKFHWGRFFLGTREDFYKSENLCLPWPCPGRFIQAVNDYVYQLEDVRNGSLDEVHATRLKFYHDTSVDTTILMP